MQKISKAIWDIAVMERKGVTKKLSELGCMGLLGFVRLSELGFVG